MSNKKVKTITTDPDLSETFNNLPDWMKFETQEGYNQYIDNFLLKLKNNNFEDDIQVKGIMKNDK